MIYKRRSAVLLATLCSFLLVSFMPAGAQSPPATPPIVLKGSHGFSATHHIFVNVQQRFARELEKRTGGRVKVQLHHSEALGKASDQFDIALKGMADFSWTVLGYTRGRFPLSSIADLPFACSTAEKGTRALWELYKLGLLDKEYASIKVLYIGTTSSNHLAFVNKRPVSLAELRGLKIRSPGGYMTSTISASGAVPVAMSGGEQYMALDRGVVDGTCTSYAAVTGPRVYEVCKYVAEVSMGVLSVGFFMNQESFKKLPKDIQEIIDNMREELVIWGGQSYDFDDKKGKEAFAKVKAEMYVFPPAERAKWVQLCKPVWQEWVADKNAKGLRGTDVHDKFLSALARLGETPIFK